MELQSRPKNDRYTRPGQYNEIERRLRANSDNADLPVLVVYAFDFRTRLGPFLFNDMNLLPAGPRAVAAALVSAGFTTCRVVQKQWSPNVKVSKSRFDGKPPAMLFVSSMQIHSASAFETIADAYKLGDERPLIFAGGPKAIYEPWDFFNFQLNESGGQASTTSGKTYSADVVCTGEEFVLMELMDRIVGHRGKNEHPRRTFHRLRKSGLLDDIPGLVFQEGDEREPIQRLINTGVQRMVQNLDELPHPMLALDRIEPPHRRPQLSHHAIPAHKLRRYAAVASLVTTHGCKFHCPYCPIPAYNQFTFRWKSGERLRDEIERIATETGLRYFFGTDDNFFNNRETVEETFTELAKGRLGGKSFRDSIFFGTEATEFDVFKNQDLLPLCRDGGLRAIWFGIEDMTAELVKKGQSPEKTKKLFEILNGHGICPMPMMMHHDGQPLWSRSEPGRPGGNLYGLLNQVNFLRKTGSVSVQVTILTPSVGSKGYEEPFEKGMVIGQAGDRPLEDFQFDGNHCIATDDPNPWRKQLNIFLAYASFYNPLNFARALLRFHNDSLWAYKAMYQLYGMAGTVRSVQVGFGWLWNLYKGPVKKLTEVPRRQLAMVPPPVTPERVTAMQTA